MRTGDETAELSAILDGQLGMFQGGLTVVLQTGGQHVNQVFLGLVDGAVLRLAFLLNGFGGFLVFAFGQFADGIASGVVLCPSRKRAQKYSCYYVFHRKVLIQ